MLKSVLKAQEEERVFTRYREAYAAANGKSSPKVGRWGRGWYAVFDGSPRVRLAELERMAERLEARAAAPKPEPAPLAAGFYWIREDAGGLWMPAEWDGRLWWAPGCDMPIEPPEVGAKLKPPA